MDMVNAIYEYGQCQYQCGNYSGASDLLYHYRILVCALLYELGHIMSANSSTSLPIMTRLPRPVGESLLVRFSL